METLETKQVSAISRFFTSGVIREMARKGKSQTFARLLRESELMHACRTALLVRDYFDIGFGILKQKSHRHEYIYKAALTHKVLLGAHSLQTASMLSEFRVGHCKADLVILNGTGTVYEIKSERDSLARLSRQIDAYKKVFAKVYVIAGENHISQVMDMVSSDIGVLKLHSRYRINELRRAEDCPDRTNSEAIFDSIRLDEARQILLHHDIQVPKLSNIEMHRALRSLFAKLKPRDAHEGMVNVLKKSRNLRPLSELVDSLPHSLQTAVLSVPLRRADHQRLLAAVNAPAHEIANWI